MRKTPAMILFSGLLLSLTGCTLNPILLSQGSLDSSYQGTISATEEGFEPIDHQGSFTYGLYPNSLVSDPNLLRSLNESADSGERNQFGWLHFQGKQYCFLEASPYSEEAIFHNSSRIQEGAAYWFLCEPIRWITLKVEGGTALLLSEFVLDCHRFNTFYDGLYNGHYANAWQDSELERYCNDDFFHSAFFYSHPQDNMKKTTLNNSPETTDSQNNEVNGGSTEDWCFPLTYQDYEGDHSSIGEPKRISDPTDYARAKGVPFFDNGAAYWTRSPADGYKEAWSIQQTGDYARPFCEEKLGLRPAITLIRD